MKIITNIIIFYFLIMAAFSIYTSNNQNVFDYVILAALTNIQYLLTKRK